LTGIAAIKHDMQEPRPMDRLICGDVATAKPNWHARGVRGVDAGYQGAILVPTTILAAHTAARSAPRMSEYPFQDRAS